RARGSRDGPRLGAQSLHALAERVGEHQGSGSCRGADRRDVPGGDEQNRLYRPLVEGCRRSRELAELAVHAQADPRASGRRITNDNWLTPLLGEVRSAGCPEAVGSAWWTRCRPQISAAADAAPRREPRSALLRPA